jgi:hypothetical protein
MSTQEHHLDGQSLALLNEFRVKLASASHLWQYTLLSAAQLRNFASDRGIRLAHGDSIADLWRIGLLRADLVTSEQPISLPGFTSVGFAEGEHSYCDLRVVLHRPSGFGGAFSEASQLPPTALPLFHPFRLYLLYHIDRVFDSLVSSTQYLTYPEGMQKVCKHEIESLDRWTSTVECSNRFDYWNHIAELAIALEPLGYASVYNTLRIRFPETEQSIPLKLDQLRSTVGPLLQQLGDVRLRQIREDLGQAAEHVDSNRSLHVLLRLMSSHERSKLRGHLGASMQFLEMAEIIRRCAEAALHRELPEEDQIGFGQWMEGARRNVYGTERVFDASRTVLRDYLSSMGLDYGVKARCYVEGDSEYGALASALGDSGGIELVNLRGQVSERHGRGLAFADALRRDGASHIFSIVLIDNDRKDYVRILRKAAASNEFLCPFFVWDPDLEFGNFSALELLDIALSLRSTESVELEAKHEKRADVLAARSNKEFFRALADLGVARVAKDEAWGVALMNFALNNPTLPPGHKSAGQTRPLIEAARLLYQARRSGYARSVATASVDPNTGRLTTRTASP